LDLLTHQKKNSLKWLTGLLVVILFAILFFGLRPKDFNFSNNVKWTHNESGIRFNKYGIAYTDPIEELRKEKSSGENGFSIEIALKPLNYEEGFNFIFSLHNGNDRKQLLLGQWRSWIIAMNEDDYDHKRRVKRISVNTASRSPARADIEGINGARPAAIPVVLTNDLRVMRCFMFISHFPFGFSLEHIQASNSGGSNIRPTQRQTSDDFPDLIPTPAARSLFGVVVRSIGWPGRRRRSVRPGDPS